MLSKLGKELLFFDGGMGTLLQKEGLLPGELPENWNIEKKEVIRNIHRAYYEAGSNILLTNTFGANRVKYHDAAYTLKQVIEAAVDNVKSVSDEVVVALDMGPTGKLLKPMGDLSFEDSYEAFKEVAIYGGGNSAIDGALYLSNICKKVYLIYRQIKFINLIFF